MYVFREKLVDLLSMRLELKVRRTTSDVIRNKCGARRGLIANACATDAFSKILRLCTDERLASLRHRLYSNGRQTDNKCDAISGFYNQNNNNIHGSMIYFILFACNSIKS